MQILVVHQNFPGQFGHVARSRAAWPNWQARGLGRQSALGLPHFGPLDRCCLSLAGHANQHPYLFPLESAVAHGRSALRAMLGPHQTGFRSEVTAQQLVTDGVVTEAQLLMVIVPDGAKVTAEVTLGNKDIGVVSPTQETAIKLQMFPYTR